MFTPCIQSLLKLTTGEPKKALQVTDEAVDVPLIWHLFDDVFIVVISQTTTQLLIIHGRLAFPFSPSPCNLWRVNYLEFPVALVGPLDAGLALSVCE